MSNCFRPFLKIILKSYFVVKFLCRELYRWNRLEAADLWREALRTPRSRHRPPPPGPFVFPKESGPVKQRLPAPPRPPGATTLSLSPRVWRRQGPAAPRLAAKPPSRLRGEQPAAGTWACPALSALPLSSIFIHFLQCHSVLISVPLREALPSGRRSPTALFFVNRVGRSRSFLFLYKF